MVGAVLGCNWLVIAGLVMLHGNIFRALEVALPVALFTATALALVFARGVRWNLALIAAMLALHWAGWLLLSTKGA